MNTTLAIAVIAISFLAGAAHADVHEVRMLNRNETGSMPFEPDFLRVRPGDTIRFLATHPSHNAASMPEIIPAGAEQFRGKINQEIEVTFEVDGIYGIKCLPHYGMGMVMLVVVGNEPVANFTIPDALPAAAKKRFEEIIERANATSSQ